MTNLPVDPTQLAEYNAATSRRNTALAGFAQQRASGLSDYGYTEGSHDPNVSGFGALTIDPNNPFSKAALLKRSYDQSRRASGQSMASRGQLYAGAYQNTQDAINRGQLGAEDTLQKGLTRFLAQNTQGFHQAGTDFQNTIAGSSADAVARATSNPNYNPSPASTAVATPTKATASVGRPQKTVSGKRYYQRASDNKWIPL
jgi:hypothetical protein